MPELKEHGLLGIYINAAEDVTRNVIVTLDGLLVYAREWTLIRFEDIDTIKTPADKLQHRGELYLKMKEGVDKTIVIGGRFGPISDVYQFGRFLDRTTRAIRKKPRQPQS